jgi:hypothetical protein
MHPARTRWPSSSVGSARSLWLGCWLCCFALAAPSAPLAHAIDAAESNTGETREAEYRVKAAFLYHFLGYTTWPQDCFEGPEAPITVLVVGEDPFGPHLRAALEDKVVGGRGIKVLHSPEVPPQIGAQLVFAGRLSKPEVERLLGLCRGKPVLLFGERPGFADAGAQGNFYLEDGKVRFEVNVEALTASRLELSSQLLKLARIVRTAKEPSR